jgi:hypothetical protein
MDGSAKFPRQDRTQELETTQARQATSGMGVRYVLAISTVAAFVLMSFIYYFFFAT